MKREWVVYWLFDANCTSPAEDGLVGATGRLWRRMNQHRESGKWGDFRMEIIFRGSKQEALAIEQRLRPTPGIGWNVGVGGFANGSGIKGIPKSPEHRTKQRAAALKRYADPKERERTARAVKKGFKGIDRSGANNPRFGKPVSEETKEKMRQRIAQRGGVAGEYNPNYRHGRYTES